MSLTIDIKSINLSCLLTRIVYSANAISMSTLLREIDRKGLMRSLESEKREGNTCMLDIEVHERQMEEKEKRGERWKREKKKSNNEERLEAGRREYEFK